MSRMKTFFTYLILFLLFYIFTNVICYISIRSTLNNIEDGDIEFQNPAIVIDEAKASKVHAIIKGKMQTDEQQEVQYKYVKIDMISEMGNVVSSKYIDISDIANGGEKEFKIKTNAENIKKYIFTLTDVKETSEIQMKAHEISEILLGALLVWMII